MAFTERVVVEVDWTDENKGTEIVGRLVSIEVVKYKDGPGLVYTLKTGTPGEVIRFKGASRLNQRLNAHDVGKLIAVRYNGTDTSRQMSVGMSFPKDFTVGVDEESNKPAQPNAAGVAITDDDIPF